MQIILRDMEYEGKASIQHVYAVHLPGIIKVLELGYKGIRSGIRGYNKGIRAGVQGD